MKYFETDGAFYKDLAKIALPVALQSIITTGVNLVDTIMLGQLGETALSASSLANHFISLFLFLCMGISMGSSVLTSRFWGARDFVSLKKVITVAMRFGILLALLFTVVNIAVPEQIMSLYSKETEVILEGAIYLRWSTITFLLTGLSTVATNIMRSVGLTHIPFIASISAFLINIGGNYIFIFGKFGAPRMGVAGAALGTVIARIVETAVICGYFWVVDQRVRYRVKDLLSPCRDMVGEFLRVSVPVMLSDGLLGVGDNVLAVIMGHIGSSFVSANAITVVVQRISTIFITGLSYSGCFIIGKTLGEGEQAKVKRQGYTFLILGLVIGALAGGITFLIRTPVINAYNITADTKLIAEQLMDAISIIIIFRSTNSILTKGVLRGGGDTRFLFLADTITMWCIAIPLGALAGLVLHLPAFWVFVFLYSDQIIKAVWCVFRLRSGKWVKKIRGVEDLAKDKEVKKRAAANS